MVTLHDELLQQQRILQHQSKEHADIREALIKARADLTLNMKKQLTLYYKYHI